MNNTRPLSPSFTNPSTICQHAYSTTSRFGKINENAYGSNGVGKKIQYLLQTIASVEDKNQQKQKDEEEKNEPDLFVSLLLEDDDRPFVDKSLLIKELVRQQREGESESTRCDSITLVMPGRMGKSTALHMVRKFLQIELDDETRAAAPNSNGTETGTTGTVRVRAIQHRVNRKLFVGGEMAKRSSKETGDRLKMLAKLKIARDEQIMRYQGEYPVVMFNLAAVTGDNYAQVEHSIDRQLDITIRHCRQYYRLPAADQKEEKHQRPESVQNRRTRLRDMIKTLGQRFQRKVYLLIDEYDKPIISAYLKFGANNVDEFDRVHSLLQSLLEDTVAENECLERTILTGTVPVLLADIRGGLNNADRYTLLDGKFAKFFGFTADETDELLAKRPTRTHPTAIKDWYNGYNFGDDELGHPVIYNTRSVVECLLRDGTLRPYWIDADVAFTFHSFVNSSNELQDNVPHLIANSTIFEDLAEFIEFVDLELLCSPTLYAILVFCGFLNAIRVDDFTPWSRTYCLTVPNREISWLYFSYHTRRNKRT